MQALKLSAAALATCAPARVDPVNEIMSISRMCANRLPHAGSITVDQVEHTLGQTRLVHDFGQEHGAERRVLRRLGDHRAARRKRGRNLVS